MLTAESCGQGYREPVDVEPRFVVRIDRPRGDLGRLPLGIRSGTIDAGIRWVGVAPHAALSCEVVSHCSGFHFWFRFDCPILSRPAVYVGIRGIACLVRAGRSGLHAPTRL